MKRPSTYRNPQGVTGSASFIPPRLRDEVRHGTKPDYPLITQSNHTPRGNRIPQGCHPPAKFAVFDECVASRAACCENSTIWRVRGNTSLKGVVDVAVTSARSWSVDSRRTAPFCCRRRPSARAVVHLI